jgi:hypothetical protein
MHAIALAQADKPRLGDRDTSREGYWDRLAAPRADLVQQNHEQGNVDPVARILERQATAGPETHQARHVARGCVEGRAIHRPPALHVMLGPALVNMYDAVSVLDHHHQEHPRRVNERMMAAAMKAATH